MIWLLGNLRGADPLLIIQIMLGVLLGALVGMTIHEWAHNYVAYRMGDRTPVEQGRLTLNPLVHINPMGFLMFVLIGFGVLGSAPINPRRMHNPRWGYLAAVAGGPFSNLLLAILLGIIYRILIAVAPPVVISGQFSLVVFLLGILTFMIYMNLLLFLFNLIPLFPLDGWYIVYALLPPDLAYRWERTAQYSQFIFLGLILISFTNLLPPALDPLNLLISQPLNFLMGLILG